MGLAHKMVLIAAVLDPERKTVTLTFEQGSPETQVTIQLRNRPGDMWRIGQTYHISVSAA